MPKSSKKCNLASKWMPRSWRSIYRHCWNYCVGSQNSRSLPPQFLPKYCYLYASSSNLHFDHPVIAAKSKKAQDNKMAKRIKALILLIKMMFRQDEINIFEWCAWPGSNWQPSASEADTLSNWATGALFIFDPAFGGTSFGLVPRCAGLPILDLYGFIPVSKSQPRG